jgi:uncharacterized protein YehS (DUF1456 family)
MQFIPTNDVFHHLCLLLQIHKDNEKIIDLFKSKGWDVSRAQIKAWRQKTGRPSSGYREMPREALDDFISALHEAKIVNR